MLPKRNKTNGLVYELRLPVGKNIRGILEGYAVWVYDPEHIEILDTHGSFGKGLLSRGKPDFQERVMKGEVGFEANRPFQRARPYLKNRRSKKNNPGNTAGTSESNIIALEEKPEATTTMLHDAMDVDDADQTSRKRKRDTEDTSESGNPVAEAMIDPEALNVREPVQLMLEEAFFLNYVIGCLQIETVDKACKKIVLSTGELWKLFNSMQNNFLNTYIAYHYYRSLGWVPKPGSKMGVDLAVYQLGPRYTHARYGVLIIPVSRKDHTEILAQPDAFLHLRWHKLGALFRVIHGAAKDLLCAFVVHPEPDSGINMDNPSCLSEFSVEELVVDRWVPKEDRDAAEGDAE